MSLSNYPPSITSYDLPGWHYAVETDLVEALCEQEGYDYEKLTDHQRERLAILLMSSEDRAIAYLNSIREDFDA